jgi:hypothetical protein
MSDEIEMHSYSTTEFDPQYSCSVLLSAILIVAGRYLPVKGGHAPADYE